MPTFIKPGFWEKKVKGYKEWLNLDQLIESKTPTSTYKVYTALLTQTGGDNTEGITGGSLTIGVTYEIYDTGDPAGDWTNVGAPNNNIGTKFVATGTTPNSWGDAGQLNFNTGAPVVTVLENTIGNVWFTYESEGYYHLMSDLLFTQNKIWTCITLNVGGMGDNISNSIYYNSNGDLLVITGIGGDSALNGLLNNTPIEIRVYN